jgi:hypothetical protein
MTAAAKLATYADLVALPEDVKAEVLGGELVTQPSPSFSHVHVQGGMSHYIGGPLHFDGGGGSDGWWIVCEIDVRFTAHDIVRPDVIGWRRSRLTSPRVAQPIDVAPDWICEVLSPSSTKRDRLHKFNLYARHGVPYYWLVDPDARLLEAYALDGGQWKSIGVYDETASARIAPFAAIELPVGRLFLPEPPPAGP